MAVSALGPARLVLVAARQLDDALHRLGAGVAEEHLVGEAVRGQALGQARALGDLVEVGDVPQLGRLLGECGDQVRVGVGSRGPAPIMMSRASLTISCMVNA